MGRLMSRKKRKKQSDIHQEDIEVLSEEGFEDAVEEADEAADAVETDRAEDAAGKERSVEGPAESGEDPAEDAEDLAEDGEDPEEDLVYVDQEEELESGEKKRKRRRRRRAARKENKGNREKKSLGKKPWIIAGSIAGGLLVIYLGISAFFIGHFFINTTINGKDFSGRSVADVEEYLKEQVKDYELELIELDNATDVIKGSDISLVYREDSSVEDELKKQNPILWITSLFSKTSQNVNIKVDYDENALEDKIQSIKAVTQEQTEPASAYPKFDGNSFVVEPEVYGTAVNMEVLTEKIREHITEFEPTLDMLEEECYKLPKYTAESPEVQDACDTMNQYCKASITYPMTENVVVDKNRISTWLTYDENMQVTFNEDAVREWMATFGATYDTVGQEWRGGNKGASLCPDSGIAFRAGLGDYVYRGGSFCPAYVVYRGRICCVPGGCGHRAAHTGPGDSVRGILYTLYGKKCYPGRGERPGDRGTDLSYSGGLLDAVYLAGARVP